VYPTGDVKKKECRARKDAGPPILLETQLGGLGPKEGVPILKEQNKRRGRKTDKEEGCRITCG